MPHVGTFSRMEGLLAVISEEMSQPLSMSLTESARFLKIPVPPMVDIRSAFLNAGFLVSGTHTNPMSLKFNAPMQFYWKILHEWVLIVNSSLVGHKKGHFTVAQED